MSAPIEWQFEVQCPMRHELRAPVSLVRRVLTGTAGFVCPQCENDVQRESQALDVELAMISEGDMDAFDDEDTAE